MADFFVKIPFLIPPSLKSAFPHTRRGIVLGGGAATVKYAGSSGIPRP